MNIVPLLQFNNFSVRQLAILFLLAKNKMQLKHVAIQLNFPKPSVTRAFDGLCKLKLIKRERPDHDKRLVYGVITDKGRELLEAIK